MTPSELEDFTARFIREWTVLREGSRADRLAFEHRRDSAGEVFDRLLDDPPDLSSAWAIILSLIDHAPDDAALAFIAAGPLEDLIHRHGQSLGEELVSQARRDARFRQALGGVLG
jgi:uncharacterized protein DUF6869